MRAITVRQPWAWATIYGGKDVENRTRNIVGGYRGPLAIHAGLAVDLAAAASDLVFAQAWHDAYMPERNDRRGDEWGNVPDFRDLAEAGAGFWRGAIIGVAEVVDVHQCNLAMGCWRQDSDLPSVKYAITYRRQEQGRVCSSWAQDVWPADRVMHHLVLANPRPFAVPIPTRGRLGLWTLQDDIVEQVNQQLVSV